MKHRLSNIVISILLLILLSINIYEMAGNQRIRSSKSISEGNPYCYTEEKSGRAELSDFCVKGEYLYLLFEGAGVLEIYDLSGNYLHSYAFRMIANGRGELYTDEYYVYFEDRSHNLYSFSNGAFKTFFKYKDTSYPEYFLDAYKKWSSHDGVQYQKKWASIVALAPDGTEKTVISRPFYRVLFESTVLSAIYFICFLILAVIICITKCKTQTVDGSKPLKKSITQKSWLKYQTFKLGF